jgi:hypothetical protein
MNVISLDEYLETLQQFYNLDDQVHNNGIYTYRNKFKLTKSVDQLIKSSRVISSVIAVSFG